MSFKILRNNITKVPADAIVNTANPMPAVGRGTDTAVYEAAGREKLLAARKEIGVIERGQSAWTCIDKKFFSKIISNKDYVPKKHTVMALGLALELPLEEYEGR